MSTVTNEVLGAKLDAVSSRLAKVETQMDALPDKIDHKYLTHEVFDLRMKELDVQILAINRDILELKRKKTLINWAIPTLSAVAGSILTFLIISYLTNMNVK